MSIKFLSTQIPLTVPSSASLKKSSLFYVTVCFMSSAKNATVDTKGHGANWTKGIVKRGLKEVSRHRKLQTDFYSA